MINYKLLTPGPLTTSETVKKEMMVDHCTWDNDYKQITQKIRRELLDLAHVSPEDYTAVLMQGSGTFGVESAITSSVGKDGKLLILSNGAYGERMADIAEHADGRAIDELRLVEINRDFRASVLHGDFELGVDSLAEPEVERAFHRKHGGIVLDGYKLHICDAEASLSPFFNANPASLAAGCSHASSILAESEWRLG